MSTEMGDQFSQATAISWFNGKPGERHFPPKPRADMVSRLCEAMHQNKGGGDGNMESFCLCVPDK